MEKSELQIRLKEETMDLHREAENHPLMKAMYNKTIKRTQLIRLLANLRCVYDVVERRLLQPYIMQNSDLGRLPSIDKDIALLSSDIETEYLGKLLTPLECTDLWVAWCWSKPKDMLKAELYTRWLADLYGGRILSQKLDPFNNHVKWRDPERSIKDVRIVLDTPNTYSSVNDIVEEAVEVFDFHTELFTAIENEQ